MQTLSLPDWGARARSGCLDALRVVAFYLAIAIVIRLLDWSLDANVASWLSDLIPTPIAIIIALVGLAAWMVTLLAGGIWLAAAALAGFREIERRRTATDRSDTTI